MKTNNRQKDKIKRTKENTVKKEKYRQKKTKIIKNDEDKVNF